MTKLFAILVGAAALATLTACKTTGSGSSAAASSGISQAAGETACRDALIQFHSVNDVRVISSEPYQGGGRFVRGSVRVSADGKRELYQCVAYANGTTGEIQYLADDPNSGGGAAAQLPSSAPTPAEQACLRDVTRTTNNPDVVLLDSSFSQAGTEVIVGVGEQKARWRCIAYSDGTTAGIQSLTNEGTL